MEKHNPLTPDQIQLIEDSLLAILKDVKDEDVRAIINTVLGVVLLKSKYHLSELANICGVYAYQCLQDMDGVKTRMN